MIVRFCLRIGILVIFAAFAGIGFGRSLAALLWMSIVLCAVIGTVSASPVWHGPQSLGRDGRLCGLVFLVSVFDHSFRSETSRTILCDVL